MTPAAVKAEKTAILENIEIPLYLVTDVTHKEFSYTIIIGDQASPATAWQRSAAASRSPISRIHN